jgi:hypothetical protein
MCIHMCIKFGKGYIQCRMEFVLHSQHFSSGKDYACIVGPDGTKTFLRNIGFLHAPRDPHRIVVVHEWEYPMDKEWEPPKGQMEWKELKAEGFKRGQRVTADALLKAMKAGVCREIAEEAKIPASAIRNLHVLPIAYTEAFPKAGAGAHFRYQFWTGEVTSETVAAAQKRIERIVGSPAVQARLAADKKEKDAVGFWEPEKELKKGRQGMRSAVGSWGRIRGAFSGKMTRMYYEWLGRPVGNSAT